MAEGGERQRSFKDSSVNEAFDDADEILCDPCKSEGNSIAVEGYCQICKEYLCEYCLGVHRKLNITRSHAIFDRNQMPRRQGSPCNQDLCVEVCKTHHPEIIRFICKDHDEPGCGDCMILKHTSCKKDRVQDISDGFQNTKEFEDIVQALQKIHHVLENMEGLIGSRLKNLDITYNNIQRKVTSVRKQINEYLDQMQKKITDEAAQMKKEDETELKTLHAEHQAMKADIEAMLQMKHDSNTNVNSLFVITKQAKQRLCKIAKEINKIKQQQLLHTFLIPTENIFSNKAPLGKFVRTSTQKTVITKEPDQRTSRKPTVDAKAKHNRRITVKGEYEFVGFVDCFITDCTLLGPDRLVIIDEGHGCVKLIDISNSKVIASYSKTVLNKPDKVTSLSTSVIAVTIPDECKIQLLDVTATLTLQREIEISNICDGIAYKDGKFAVSYRVTGVVEILDIQGKVLHTIQPMEGKKYMPHGSYYITFGQDNDTVIVSDSWTDKVSVVTFRGQIMRTYTHDRLKGPRGMVITANGVLFVCSKATGCIHAVSPDFKTSKIIINKDNNVTNPESIAYCIINHKLYISNASGRGHSNRIQVYDVTI